MHIPIAVEDPPGAWVFPPPGARCTVVYEPPVPIRQLADELGVGMSLLHRQVRFGKIPVIRVGNQVCVTPDVARRIKAWRTEHPAFTRWPNFT
ncbi:hypothetical protein [Umezawaea tangerina]|uniref:hypothetical protein n=1 Tax=Umezawaea tangerina TaxID=84725 RepID=UPI0011B26292|nr:hypothetical protein [Umezawaea tangerina]